MSRWEELRATKPDRAKLIDAAEAAEKRLDAGDDFDATDLSAAVEAVPNFFREGVELAIDQAISAQREFDRIVDEHSNRQPSAKLSYEEQERIWEEIENEDDGSDAAARRRDLKVRKLLDEIENALR